MNSKLLLPLVAVLPMAVHATAPDGRPVRNSFINRPVGETSDLVAHVRSSTTVSDRYQRHFAMDRPTLLRFLAGLHRGRLAKDGVYTIYSVPAGGRLKMHVGRLRRGEAMFFNRAGHPTLVAKCGNPVVLGPSPTRIGNPAVLSPQQGPIAREMDLGIAQAAEVAAVSPMAMEPMVPEAIVEIASGAVTGAPAAFAPSAVGIGTLGGGFGVGSLLVSLTFLTPFAASSTFEGGAERKIAPVPEPLSVIALAAGFVGLTQRRRRRS